MEREKDTPPYRGCMTAFAKVAITLSSKIESLAISEPRHALSPGGTPRFTHAVLLRTGNRTFNSWFGVFGWYFCGILLGRCLFENVGYCWFWVPVFRIFK